MKFRLFTYDFPPNRGGVARFCQELYDEMKRDSIDINIMSRRVERSSHRHKRVFSFIYLYHWFILVAGRQDYVIAAKWYPEGLISYLSGKKYLLLAHGSEVLKSDRLYSVRNFLMAQVLRRAENVIVNSSFTARLINSENVVVIPLAISPERFKEKSQTALSNELVSRQKRIILTVSRLEQHKGHRFVLEALSQLDKIELNEILYVIVGEGSYRREIEDEVKRLDLMKYVVFAGSLSDEEVNSLYSISSLFMLVSEFLPDLRKVEGFGLVLLEAQANGVPVICSSLGGMLDAVKYSEGGICVDPRDSQSLARKIWDILNNEELSKNLGINGKRGIEHYYNWTRYVKDLKQVISNE